MVAYGYRSHEVPLARPGDTRKGFKVSSWRRDDESLRSPVAVSLGPHVRGYLQPHPDQQHVPTIVDGLKKRIGCVLPQPDPVLCKRFETFVRKWIRENLRKLDLTHDVSFESWISEAPYPAKRKEELRLVFEDLKVHPLNEKDFECKSFIKDEHYPEWKHARTINSRSDRFKVWSGPIFHAIEKVLFKMPYFIKKIPAPKRAKFIFDNVYMYGASYIATDYSSFEASFVQSMMQSCEFQLYQYMTEDVENGEEWYATIAKALAGTQHLRFKRATCQTKATRMSGDMCTSLGNGFTNLMVALFIGEEQGLGTLRGVFEGDDGLFCYQFGKPDPSIYAKLGFNIKLEVHTDITQASFCGLVFDVKSLVNCVDPSDILSLVGWTTSKYYGANRKTMMMLLRAKGLSLAYQYPHCPVVCRLAAYILRVTRSFDVRKLAESRNMSQWERVQLVEALSSGHPQETQPVESCRWIIEEKWGWSVAKQRRVEAYLDSLNEVQELIIDLDNDIWADYWQNYVCPPPARPCEPTIYAFGGHYSNA